MAAAGPPAATFVRGPAGKTCQDWESRLVGLARSRSLRTGRSTESPVSLKTDHSRVDGAVQRDEVTEGRALSRPPSRSKPPFSPGALLGGYRTAGVARGAEVALPSSSPLGPSKVFSGLLLTPASDRARLPAELKHITKRRKRNQPGFPQ